MQEIGLVYTYIKIQVDNLKITEFCHSEDQYDHFSPNSVWLLHFVSIINCCPRRVVRKLSHNHFSRSWRAPVYNMHRRIPTQISCFNHCPVQQWNAQKMTQNDKAELEGLEKQHCLRNSKTTAICSSLYDSRTDSDSWHTWTGAVGCMYNCFQNKVDTAYAVAL